jgi:hypothetical protein
MKSDLSKVEVGDKIFVVQLGWVEVLDKDGDFVYIKDGIRFPFDGFYCETHAHASAFTEYPFIGAEEIKQDTKVWFRSDDKDSWGVGYYSRFFENKHYVFWESQNSKYWESKKTKKGFEDDCWEIVVTKDPLK